jgi:hypothetical protein
MNEMYFKKPLLVNLAMFTCSGKDGLGQHSGKNMEIEKEFLLDEKSLSTFRLHLRFEGLNEELREDEKNTKAMFERMDSLAPAQV